MTCDDREQIFTATFRCGSWLVELGGKVTPCASRRLDEIALAVPVPGRREYGWGFRDAEGAWYLGGPTIDGSRQPFPNFFSAAFAALDRLTK